MSASDLLQECRAALASPNVQAFLRVIRAGETNQTDDAYRMMFGGQLFDSFDDHPRRLNRVGSLSSTAAGAHQFLSRTWDECRAALSLPDFSPPMQDLGAVYLIRRRGALADVLAGRIEDAIAKCAKEWASLPGSPYGQPTRTLAQALAVYEQFGGRLATDASPQPDPAASGPPAQPQAPFQQPSEDDLQSGRAFATSPEPIAMPTISQTLDSPLLKFALTALNPLLGAAPEFAKLFLDKSTGQTVPERNVAGVLKMVEIAQKALQDSGRQVSNAQAVAEAVTSDPGAKQVVREALLQNLWQFDMAEAGGGGIEGAGKRDAATRAAGDMLHSPSFWVACALLGLVYWMMGNVMGLYGADMDEKVRSAIINGAQGMILGGVVGYFFGQTTSRNRTPAS